MVNKPVFAVCGATGQQGRAVVEALRVGGGCTIRGLSRKERTGGGVEWVRADLDDPASLGAAFRGCSGVFGVLQPFAANPRKPDVAGELRQARVLVEAVKLAGVPLVISTVMLTGPEPTRVPHVDSKAEVERIVRESGVPSVVLGPAQFMDNLGASFAPITAGKIRGFMDGDVKLPWIACRDIGKAAAAVLRNPAPHLGKRYNLLGVVGTGQEACAALSGLRGGEPFAWVVPPRLLMRLFFRDFYRMRVAFEKLGRLPDPPGFTQALADTRALIGEPTGFADYFKLKGLDLAALT